MGPSALGQFWAAEFENRWYTEHQPLFHDLKSRFGQKSSHAQLKRKTMDTMMNKDHL